MFQYGMRTGVLALLAMTAIGPAWGQANTKQPEIVSGAAPVSVEQINVFSPAIDGNLMGETANREVFVILPPSYQAEADRRYPVVYGLHGYSIGAGEWMQEIHAPQTIEGAFANGVAEMIVVLPTSRNIYNGSMYSSSMTTGNFERFIADDLVAFIDENYRTIPQRESRGLVGHSMGGYGATRIGMKHADVFGSLYLMSIGGGSTRGPADLSAEDLAQIAAMESPADAANLSFFARAELAKAAAWSPNPQNPPLYLDMPYSNGELDPAIAAKWAGNIPMNIVDQYVDQLARYDGLAIEVGDADGALDGARAFSEILSTYQVDHVFDVYAGDHTSELGYRMQDHVMPFFAEHLAFE